MSEENYSTDLIIQNLADLNSESQFSVFYISYNLYSLDRANLNNATNSTINSFAFTNADNIVKFLIQGIGLSLITGLGLIGNICSIIVLLNHRMRSSISCFLIGLAICDTTILLTSLIMLGIPTILSFEHLYPELTSIYLSMGYIAPYLYCISTIGKRNFEIRLKCILTIL